MAQTSKYHAKPTWVDNVRFASMFEASRYVALKTQLQAGMIRNLELHPKFELNVMGVLIGKYTADFRYFDVTLGETIIEDAKGMPTRDYILRKKLFEVLFNKKILETGIHKKKRKRQCPKTKSVK